MVGLALIYVLGLSGLFQYMLRQSALVETFMTSVERISYYAHRIETEEESLANALLTPEGKNGSSDGGAGGSGKNADDAEVEAEYEEGLALTTITPELTDATTDGLVGSSVQDEGSNNGSSADIEFDRLFVRYRDDLPNVIKGLTAKVEGGIKIGVVGRTGSGKSSLLLALSRLNEVCGGEIRIRGKAHTSMPLPELRKLVSVIPQDPHLFSGTIRFNLDPFDE
jgi:ABC-type multidrug transport system fused ATPase/permease subunit